MTEEVYSNGPFADRYAALDDASAMAFARGVPPEGYSVHVFPVDGKWFWQAQPGAPGPVVVVPPPVVTL